MSQAMRQESWSTAQRIELIAHRGLSGLAPENTLAALEGAIQCGAHRVEFDVQLTRDGVAVVFHDDTLERTTSGKGRVGDTSYEEIRKLDAGSWLHPRFKKERVPTLDMVLDLCRGKIPVNVEIKAENPPSSRGGIEKGIEKNVVDALHRHHSVDSATVSSFEAPALERVRLLDPQIRRETLYNNPRRPPLPEDLRLSRESGARAFNVSVEELMAREELVEEAHSLGLGLKVYTVDDPRRFLKLLGLRVDGVFTNRPDCLLPLLKSGGAGKT